MIDQLATIKLREAGSARFNKPVLGTKTGTVLLDKEGAQQMFAPNSCWSKCPIKSSNEFKDDKTNVEITTGGG